MYAVTENGKQPGLFNTLRFSTRPEAKAELVRLVEIGHEGLKVTRVR